MIAAVPHISAITNITPEQAQQTANDAKEKVCIYVTAMHIMHSRAFIRMYKQYALSKRTQKPALHTCCFSCTCNYLLIVFVYTREIHCSKSASTRRHWRATRSRSSLPLRRCCFRTGRLCTSSYKSMFFQQTHHLKGEKG